MTKEKDTSELELVHDILDSQLLDQDGQSMGKADGITAELREGQPPRLLYIEQGGPVPWRRVRPRLGEWAERLGARWSVRGGQAYRIPWDKVREVGINVKIDVDADETPALAWERWLRDRVIGKIPGAASGQ
jgi:hypothetical protein